MHGHKESHANTRKLKHIISPGMLIGTHGPAVFLPTPVNTTFPFYYYNFTYYYKHITTTKCQSGVVK